MKCTCSQKDLLGALNVSIKAINATNTLPVLNNFLIKAEGKNVVVSSTNLEIAITVSFEANVSNEGSLTVPAKLLTSYVNFLKDGEVELKDEEGLNLALKAPGSKTVIKGLGADEFPAIPQVEKEASFSVKAEALTEAINQVVFAASLNKTRPILTGVYFELNTEQLKIVATDSYRLSEKTIKLKQPAEQKFKCIVPARTILELGKIISGSNDKVEVIISSNQILFKFNKIELISRLIEGQYPDYQQIIPQDPGTKAVVNLNDLVLAIKRINLFAKENSNNIKLAFEKDGKLKLTTQATQYGSEEDELAIQLEGKDNQVALNSEYMLDVFSNLHPEDILLEADSDLTPVKIKIPGQDDYLHIIMPLKL